MEELDPQSRTLSSTKSKTKSLYPTYTFNREKETVPAEIIQKKGKVFLRRKGKNVEDIFLENGPEFYKKINDFYYREKEKFKPQTAFIPIDKLEEYSDKFTGLGIYLTDRCNLDCPMCISQGFVEGEISLDEIKEILNPLESKWIYLSGGEPTLREDLPEIIEAVVESGNTPSLATNGTTLSEKKVEELRKKGLKYVHLSFAGFDEEKTQEIYGREDLVNRKLETLKTLGKHGFRVFISMTATKGMEEEVKNCIDYGVSQGFVTETYISPIVPSQKAIKEGLSFDTAPSDVVEMIEGATDGTVTRKSFLEFLKLKRELYKLFKDLFGEKSVKKFPKGNLEFFLVSKDGKYEPWIQKDTIRGLRKSLEKINEGTFFTKMKGLLGAFRKVLEDKGARFMVKELLINGLDFQELAKVIYNREDIFRIKTVKLCSFLNRDLTKDFRQYSVLGEKPEGIYSALTTT